METEAGAQGQPEATAPLGGRADEKAGEEEAWSHRTRQGCGTGPEHSQGPGPELGGCPGKTQESKVRTSPPTN